VYHRSLFAGELWREDEVVLTASTNEVGDDVLYGRCEVIQPGRAEPGTVHNCRKRHWFLDTPVIILTHSAARPAHLLQQLVANVGLWYPRILFLATKYLYNTMQNTFQHTKYVQHHQVQLAWNVVTLLILLSSYKKIMYLFIEYDLNNS